MYISAFIGTSGQSFSRSAHRRSTGGLFYPNTLPSLAKMLIGFHDIYRRMWKNIDPWGMVITRFKAKSQFKLD